MTLMATSLEELASQWWNLAPREVPQDVWMRAGLEQWEGWQFDLAARYQAAVAETAAGMWHLADLVEIPSMDDLGRAHLTDYLERQAANMKSSAAKGLELLRQMRSSIAPASLKATVGMFDALDSMLSTIATIEVKVELRRTSEVDASEQAETDEEDEIATLVEVSETLRLAWLDGVVPSRGA